MPGRARFHIRPFGQILVVCYVSGVDASGKSVSENRFMELIPGQESKNVWTKIPLKQPFSDFFTATPRAGSAPALQLDMLGERPGVPHSIGYAHIVFR